MREYETIYILKPDLPAEQISSVKEKVQKSLEKGDSQVISHADWGKRRLAYQVQKNTHAQYFYLQYLASGNLVGELERILKFDDKVLKFLTVKLGDVADVAKRLEELQKSPTQAPEDLYGDSDTREAPPSRSEAAPKKAKSEDSDASPKDKEPESKPAAESKSETTE